MTDKKQETRTVNIAMVSLERPEQVAAEKDDKSRRVIISANNAYGLPGDQLKILDTDRYMKNPVVLWNHDQWDDIPIARTTALSFNEGGDLIADFEFLPNDPFASRIQNAWDEGFINAASVGWKYRDYEETEPILLEWSLVSIPRDPEALRAGYEKLMNNFLDDKIKTALEGNKKDKGFAGVADISPKDNVVEEGELETTEETASEEVETETTEETASEETTEEEVTAETETEEVEAEAETEEEVTAETETEEVEEEVEVEAEAETEEDEAEAETADAETEEEVTAETETEEVEEEIEAEAETEEEIEAEAETEEETSVTDINEYRDMIDKQNKLIEQQQDSINAVTELVNKILEKMEEEKAASEEEVETASEETVEDDPQVKLELIRQAEKLLDENKAKNLSKMTVREILEVTIGDSVTDVANRTDDYLMACVDQMVESRKNSPSHAPIVENTASARMQSGNLNIMTLIKNRNANHQKEMN